MCELQQQNQLGKTLSRGSWIVLLYTHKCMQCTSFVKWISESAYVTLPEKLTH